MSRPSQTVGAPATVVRIDDVLGAAVSSGAIPNAVGVVADEHGVVYEGAFGPRAAGDADPVGADSTFRIASMTKVVTTVAALQLRDRGQLDFDAPVDTYCPDFAGIGVIDAFDGDGPRRRPPATRATVRQLVTHTAGLAYGYWNAELARWDETVASGTVFTAPMVTEPGTRCEYGISTDWLGRCVEAASAQSLDGYLTEHVFDPLGMSSTTFRLDDDERARCVPVHVRGDDGRWLTTDIDWDQDPDHWPGGHGLYSTPRDFLSFQRMLLGGGALGTAATILDRGSVDEAFANQIGELWFPAELRTTDPAWSSDLHIGSGMKWGWGLLLNTSRRPGMRAIGSGSWLGMFNTSFWVDRATGVTGALYTQCLPLGIEGATRTYTDFERAVYATLHP
jgi:CubicO group peptidase (beta-lactamase class C family)